MLKQLSYIFITLHVLTLHMLYGDILFFYSAAVLPSIVKKSISNHAPTISGTPETTLNRYNLYQFQPLASDKEDDPLIFSIENKPEWSEFNTTTGLLSGIAANEGNFTNIIISVSDGKHSVSMEAFDIEVKPARDLAFLFGKATQGTDNSYTYYEPASKAIDNNSTTYNHTSSNNNENWWQVELPAKTNITQIAIQSRSSWTSRLEGAKVYITQTPYNGTVDETSMVKILEDSADKQIITFDPAQSGNYLIVKGADDHIVHMVSVEVYGEAPAAPIFVVEKTDYLISGTTDKGTVIGSSAAMDYQEETLHYSIVENVPFSIGSDGALSVSDTLNKTHYSFTVQVTDGTHVTTRTITVDVTSANVIEEILTSGDVIGTKITEKDLITAAREEIALLKSGNILLQTIYGEGNISYVPGNSRSQVIHLYGDPKKSFPIIYGNNNHILAVAGENHASRFTLFASNPFYYFANQSQLDYEPYMENIIDWLTDTENNASQSKTIALSFVDSSDAVENWINEHYTSWTLKTCNDNSALEDCYEGTDLIIIGNSGTSEDANALKLLFPTLFNEGKSILYLHKNWGENALSNLIEEFFTLSFPYGGNYWADDAASWENVIQMQNAYFTQGGIEAIDTILEHFEKKDYAFDWSKCKNSHGEYGENYDDCREVDGLDLEFFDGMKRVKTILEELDSKKKNLFDMQIYTLEEYKLYKLLALLGDKIRQSVSFPMDKVLSDQQAYFRSLYADASIYSYRLINPSQPDMGNFSRSDFSHIITTTIQRNLTSKKPFRSAGLYLLPGETVKISRTDKKSEVKTKIFINSIRSGATHIYQANGYNRPKYLQSKPVSIENNESIFLTHPYGGMLQIEFDTNDKNVSFTFEHVAQHPVWAYWMSNEEKSQFESALAEEAFEWAEVITPNFELHSKVNKMQNSIADDKWNGELDTFIDAINRYTSNYPNSLAGYKGPGIAEISEVQSFAQEHNLTLYNSDFVKHMNADQASCGYGCSGNPYDAYWAFDPVGHGDIHEIGHGLEKRLFRFEGWNYHASTNPYSYYTKSIFNQDHEESSVTTECQNLPFKTLFTALKESLEEENRTAYLQENLWKDSGWSEQVLFEIEAMMLTQYMKKLDNGWHLLTLLHLLERDRERIKRDWENQKATIGFDSYTLDEFKNISNNDWLIVSYSFAAKLDFRPFFDMYGMLYSQKASDQVATFGFEVAEEHFFVSTPAGYCTKDTYGEYLDKEILDFNETFPY